MADQPAQTSSRIPMDGFDSLVVRMWERYNARFPLFLRISFIAGIAQVVFSILPSLLLKNWLEAPTTTPWPLSQNGTVMLIGGVVLGLIASVWGNLALLWAVAQPSQTPTWQSAFRSGGRLFWASLTTGLMAFFLILLCLSVFIVPVIFISNTGINGLLSSTLLVIMAILVTIYLGNVLIFANYLIFSEQLKNGRALRRSRELVRGYWWSIFWRYFGITLLYGITVSALSQAGLSIGSHFSEVQGLLIGGILSSVVAILSLAFPVIAIGVIYENIVAIKSATPQTSA